MNLHSDYDKLSKIYEIMQRVYGLRSKLEGLKQQKEKNLKIIKSPGEYKFAPCTSNYEAAREKEAARTVAIADAKRKRRMSGLLICSLVLQIAVLIAMFVLMIPSFSMLVAEPLLFSAGLILASFLAQRAAMNDGYKNKFFTTASIVLMVILLLTYGVSMLASLNADALESSVLNSFSGLSFDIPPIALLLGMAQAVIGVLFTVAANRMAENIRVAYDQDVLDKAKAADETETKKREEAAKRQHAQNVKNAKNENVQLDNQIATLQKQIAEKEAEVAAVGILGPSEYDLAAKYCVLIYNETMSSGRQVDLSWARWKYGQEENERMLRNMRARQELADSINQTISDAYRREEERQEREKLVRSAERAAEAADELRKALEKKN